MDDFLKELNAVLVDTYRSILRVEQQMLRRESKLDLSISELHMIETIAKDRTRGKTISDIAQEQSLALPTVTVAINKLAKKGYVEKVKDGSDGRMVYVRVTRQGRRADAAHRYFHRQMLLEMTSDITPQERAVLLAGIRKLNRYFKATEQGNGGMGR